MERLTERFDGRVMKRGCHGPCRTCNGAECSDIYPLIDRLAAYEDTMPLERAQELSQAEKDGRLVVLPPIKIGDTAFFIINNRICEGRVYRIRWEHIKSRGVRGDIFSDSFGGIVSSNLRDFGKSVFLTREEAEAALRKRE